MTSGPVTADLILDRARVHTMDAVRRTAMAIALREGTILAVGTSREVRAVAGPATRVVDLGGLTVVPGFDGHPHMGGSAVLLGHQQRHRSFAGSITVRPTP